MQIIVRAAAAAMLWATAPASAALIQYDFASGGPGAHTHTSLTDGFTGEQAEESNNFSLTSRFILDTSNLAQAFQSSWDANVYSEYRGGFGGTPSPLTGTAAKIGGSILQPTLPQTGVSEFFAYQDPAGQQYLKMEASFSTPYERTELAGGEYKLFSIFMAVTVEVAGADIFDWVVVDGMQIISGLNASAMSGTVGIRSLAQESYWDDLSNFRGATTREILSTGQIISASSQEIGEGGPDPVPEPAALSLLGLGVIGVALYRRRGSRGWAALRWTEAPPTRG